MLETVKEYISNLEDVPFDEFYLEYVKDMQDEIIDRNVNAWASQLTCIDYLPQVESRINVMHTQMSEL